MVKLTKNSVIVITVVIAAICLLTISLIFVLNNKNDSSIDESLIDSIDKKWSSAKSDNQPKYLTEIDKKSSYEIKSVKKDGDFYTIKAIITAPDLGDQLLKLGYETLPNTDDTNEIDEFLCEQLEMAENKQTEAYIYAEFFDEKYNISFSDDFVNAMSGNLYSYSQKSLIDMLENYNEEIEK